jgi:uncharacterized protein YcfJ
MIGVILSVTAPLGACATNDGYGYDDRNASQRERAVVGAAVGAAAGAALGSVVGGVSGAEGAAVGAVAGGIIGATTSDRRWHRDNRGDCFYVNDRGERFYDYGRRC